MDDSSNLAYLDADLTGARLVRSGWQHVGTDDTSDVLLLLAAEVAVVAWQARVPQPWLTSWAGGGLLGPDTDRTAHGVTQIAPWVRVGVDAPLWRAAGISVSDAQVLAALPPRHPERPHLVELKALAALRHPDLFSGR